MPHVHRVFHEAAVLGHLGVGLGDDVLRLVDGRQVLDLLGDLALGDLAVRRFEEAVLVGLGVGRQGVDEADVRAFRRLDRADAPVVRGVDVAHLEAGAFAGETAWAQRGDAALVGHLGERVGLVHELRQLAGAEELLHRRGDRLGVDEVLGHQAFGLGQGKTLLHRPFHAHQADAELVLGHLADRLHAAVAQVVDVVHRALGVADVHQGLQHADDVFLGKDAWAGDAVAPQAAVELHAPHGREVVALRREEQVVEQVLGGVLGGRLAGAHHAVDVHQRRQTVGRDVQRQGVGNVRAAVDVVGVDGVDALDALLHQPVENLVAELGVAADEDLAAFLVDDVHRGDAVDQVFAGHVEAVAARLLQGAHVAGGDAAAGFHQHLALGVLDVEGGDVAAQPLRHQIHREAFLLDVEHVLVEEQAEDFFRGVVQGAQQHGGRQLAAAVDAHPHGVLGVELEVQPGAAVGNDAGVVEDLAGGVGLALVVVEEDARRAVQLRHHHALGAVDDEGAVHGHERDLAHVDVLLLDVLHAFAGGFAVVDDEAHAHAQGRGVGEAAQHALAHVEGRLAELVVHVLQGGVAGVAGDGEHRAERAVQALVLEAAGAHALLQELRVGILLDGQQVGDAHRLRQLAEVLADALFLCEAVGHAVSVLLWCRPLRPLEQPAATRRRFFDVRRERGSPARRSRLPRLRSEKRPAPAHHEGAALAICAVGALPQRHVPCAVHRP